MAKACATRSDTAKYPKNESYGRIDAIKAEIVAAIPEDDNDKRKLATRAFERLREYISATTC